jgi:hypothetical protein
MICQVRTDCLITYAQNCYGPQLSPLQRQMMIERIKEAAKTRYSGILTMGAKKRMCRAIDILIQISKPIVGINEVTSKKQKHTLSFITLTIPPSELLTAESGYKKLLSHFIQWLRRTKKVKTYVWKAEFQKNGQLHYHITTPAWIHYQEIKDKWNNLMKASGLLDDYFKNKGHYGANSTDIHEVRNIKNLGGYLKKEFAKSVQNQQTKGKLWDCSVNLKDNKFFDVEYEINLLRKIDAMVQDGTMEKISLDQCNIYKSKQKSKIQEPLSLKQIQDYENYIKHILAYSRPEKNQLS